MINAEEARLNVMKYNGEVIFNKLTYLDNIIRQASKEGRNHTDCSFSTSNVSNANFVAKSIIDNLIEKGFKICIIDTNPCGTKLNISWAE